jgi:hypothetical protein
MVRIPGDCLTTMSNTRMIGRAVWRTIVMVHFFVSGSRGLHVLTCILDTNIDVKSQDRLFEETPK